MDERVTAHIVGPGISVGYFLCIALAAAGSSLGPRPCSRRVPDLVSHTSPCDHPAAACLARNPSRTRPAVFPVRFPENGWRRSAP